MARIVYTANIAMKLFGCLHLTWENVLMDTGQTYDCLILDDR